MIKESGATLKPVHKLLNCLSKSHKKFNSATMHLDITGTNGSATDGNSPESSTLMKETHGF